MKKKFAIIIIVVVTLSFLILIYPTPYYYTSIKINGNEFPVKINRITDSAKILTPKGWDQLNDDKKDYNSEEIVLRDHKGQTFEEYFEELKKKSSKSETLDKNSEFFKWRKKILGLE